MEVGIKLMGMLKGKISSSEKLELPDGATIADALDALEIPRESVHVFTINNQLIRDQSHALADRDELTILPPVGGG